MEAGFRRRLVLIFAVFVHVARSRPHSMPRACNDDGNKFVQIVSYNA